MGPLSSCLSKARFACAGVLENPSLETCKLIARSWQKTDIFFPAGQADPVQPTLIKLDPSCGIAPAWEKAMKFASILQFAPVTAGCGYQANPMPAAAVPYRHRFRSHAHNTAAGGPACTRTVTGPQFGGNSAVFFRHAAQPTSFGSGTRVTAMVPATAVATSGTIPVLFAVPRTASTARPRKLQCGRLHGELDAVN